MNKKCLLVIATLFAAIAGSTQTLFTYGPYSVPANDFLRAYYKNNTQPVANKKKAMQDYLELYINSRLKIREAYLRGYDTTPQIRAEVSNLRNQIIENYMSDTEVMSNLVKEAFQRSQKDIHVGHIYIAVVGGDSLTAYRQAHSIYDQLQNGANFTTIAAQSSHDPTAKTNKGDIGWITALTLPYPFESTIYALKPGQHSTVVRSKSGYHIFKNIAERKAVGKMKAKQILLAFPPGADDAVKKQIAKRADSLYARIIAGSDFSKLATTFSNDYLTAINGGSMPDFGVGQFDAEFENRVWALAKDGAVTKPFQTAHGWHIVKRVSLVPVVTDPNNKVYEQDLRQRVTLDQRWKLSREVIVNKVVKLAGYKEGQYDRAALWAFTDSLLDRRPLGIGSSINGETVIFKLGDSSLTASNWIGFAQTFRFRSDGSGRKAYEEVMNDFKNAVIFQYYRDHLESFNDEFRYQMSEFTDGNLFFEIMQQEIWNRAHSDTTELLALYDANKAKYNWQPSADAVIFFCSDAAVAKTLYDQLKKNPSKWRSLSEALAEKVVADSSRYEWAQIPNLNKALPAPGMITTPLRSTTDNSASFAYIIKVYPQPAPRSFAEARGLVINDYQTLLEEQWLKRLKEKYPVKVDWAVFESIAK